MKYLNLPKNYNGVIPSMFMVEIEQPPEGWKLRGVYFNEAHFYLPISSEGFKIKVIKLPYAVGDVVGVREKGKVIAHEKIVSVDVKRVRKLTFGDLKALGYSVVKGCLNNMSLGESASIETTKFINWFNSFYTKLRPVKEKGKIVSYRCWVYDMDSWKEWYKNTLKKSLNREFQVKMMCSKPRLYKGLPLKIIVNPFVLVLAGNKYVNNQ
ncbi:MAG TPA: hypothetical protein ENH82_06900 [bacterium]|nr:hypothetical protein [bacterium]